MTEVGDKRLARAVGFKSMGFAVIEAENVLLRSSETIGA
jgi:hypothetical protein